MAGKIQIKLLGEFHLYVDGAACDEKLCKTKKGSMLLQYLILQAGKSVSRNELYAALWPGDVSANPENALKTLISRTRVLLEEIRPEFAGCIGSNHGGYCFQEVEGCTVDVYEFTRLCHEIGPEPDALTPELRRKYQQILTVYTGDLMQYGAGEPWMVSSRVELHNRYTRAVYHYISLLRDARDYDEIIRAARVGLDVDAFDEQLHIDLMDALVKAGRSNEALQEYKHVTQMYYRYMGSQPPRGIQEFYRQIISSSNDLEVNIDIVSRELAENDEISGAFVCEYAVFKDIYSLQVRSMERLGMTMFIALLKVDRVDGKPMEPLRMDEVMKRLQQVLVNNLRKGDTISQFSPSQFALLLPAVNYETGQMVLERIRRAFYQEQANSNIMLTYKMGPITSQGERTT